MTYAEAIAFLRDYNRWRRGDDAIQHPDPDKVGVAIDAACSYMEQLNESNAVLLADMRHYREMAEELLEKNAKQAAEIARIRELWHD